MVQIYLSLSKSISKAIPHTGDISGMHACYCELSLLLIYYVYLQEELPDHPTLNSFTELPIITSLQIPIFIYRIPKLWNALPEINLTLSLDQIKKKLYNFLWNHFIQNFDPSNNCTLHFICPCCNCKRHPSTPGFRTL